MNGMARSANAIARTPAWAILILTFSTLGAQLPEEIPVRWTNTVVPAGGYKVGDVVTLRFNAAVIEHWHLYSVRPKPPGQLGATPTTLNLDPETRGVELVGALAEFGDVVKEYDDVFEVDEYYFKKSAYFEQKVKITAPDARVVGFVRYQSCNEKGKCVVLNNEFDFNLKAAAAGEKPVAKASQSDVSPVAAAPQPDTTAAANPTILSSPEAGSTSALSSAAENRTDKQKSLLTLFFWAMAGGLAAFLTPCVFPMAPMTISFFTKRNKSSRAAVIRDALIYTLSIIFMFVVLGLAITLVFGASALYNLSTNPWVNLGFFALLVIFGLSFLGAFELTLPGSWSSKAHMGADRGGMIGIFFLALTLVIASFSCTGPIAGFILVDAAGGSLWAPTVGMTGFAMGFAAPFSFIALFPGMMKALPKSGGWLNAVKVVLGFLELALSLKFLSQADLYWHLGILDREIFIAVWIVLSVLLGVYLLGKLILPHDTPLEYVSVPRFVLATLCFSFALYLVPGLWGAPLNALSGLLPPSNDAVGVRIAPYYAAAAPQSPASSNPVCNLKRKYADLLAHHAPDGFCLFYDLDEGLQYARQVGKPVLLDFTGHTCANCREMERKVWSQPAIRSLMNDKFVVVSLYVDEQTKLDSTVVTPEGEKLRTLGDKYIYLQKTRYKTISQPYYVVVDGRMNTLSPGVGYTPNADEYKAFLERGLRLQ
jgi:thiol:disulfide interchange protein DsbD